MTKPFLTQTGTRFLIVRKPTSDKLMPAAVLAFQRHAEFLLPLVSTSHLPLHVILQKIRANSFQACICCAVSCRTKISNFRCRGCALDIASFLGNWMLQLARASTTATHGSAEAAQDVVSCLYLLIQRHGQELSTTAGAAGRASIVRIGEAMLAVLQVVLHSRLLRRDWC